MEYALAKALQDAGFPQEGAGKWVGDPASIIMRRADRIYAPTLEELIAACGDEFVSLRNFRRELESFNGKGKTTDLIIGENYGGLKGGDWIAECTRTTSLDEGTTERISAAGHTPEGAVARLWLVLQK